MHHDRVPGRVCAGIDADVMHVAPRRVSESDHIANDKLIAGDRCRVRVLGDLIGRAHRCWERVTKLSISQR